MLLDALDIPPMDTDHIRAVSQELGDIFIKNGPRYTRG